MGNIQPGNRSWGARPPRAWLDTPSYPAVRRASGPGNLEFFFAFEVFREGAENGARGGRAPQGNFGFRVEHSSALSQLAADPPGSEPPGFDCDPIRPRQG